MLQNVTQEVGFFFLIRSKQRTKNVTGAWEVIVYSEGYTHKLDWVGVQQVTWDQQVIIYFSIQTIIITEEREFSDIRSLLGS
jgi:hypothetical protein